ncbi:hypothetical protein H4Q32_008891 [Labeo rohita]|uniref:Uncharacterized protein n=1 Tax=Labeo rohita TaxID=84645 RepID=A0ABQ8M4P7_LABRO|nr:hypothetical protein H4Q32_008891 [Labeo rohita]
MLGQCLQCDHALKHVCIQSNGKARHHRRGDVETRKLKSTCGACSRQLLSFSKRSSICCLYGSEAWESVLEGADCPRLRPPRLSFRFCRGRVAAEIVGIAYRSTDRLETELAVKQAASALKGVDSPRSRWRCLRASDMWRRPWFLSQGPVLVAPCRHVMLATDASLTGSGVVMSGHPARGLWSGHHSAWHFSCLEMLAVFQVLNTFTRTYEAVRIRRILTPMVQDPPHSLVPVSPQCPREISLPTLPVLQGAAVSSEPTPQSSARKRSGAGELATPAGVSTAASSAVSCWSSFTGHRAAQTTPEASLERLVPLVDYLAAWKLLPNVSAWVLRTVKRGYHIQFGAPLPPFNGVFPTVVSPEQGLVMEQEVGTLLRKEAIEVVPPQDRESGFYSRYFIVPKKDGGLRPILDLRLLNRSVMRLKFKMLTVNQVGIRILNYINDWLILAQSEYMVVQHRDVVLAHLKELGLRLNAKKSVLSPLQRTTYLGVVWDSTTMQARLSPARIESILTAVTRVKEGRSLTVKQFQRLLGLMAAASTVIPFGLLYMRPLQWWLRTKGFSPEGKPVLHDQGHAAMPTCLRHVEEALVPVSGPGVTSSLSPRNASDGCVSHRLGCGHEWPPARGLWSSSHLTWHINCLEMLAMFRALKHFLPDLIGRHVLVRTDNTAVVYYINHQRGLRSRPIYKLVHQILVWSQDKLLSLRAIHVPGHLNMGADILSRQGPRPGEWMLHPEVVKQIWRVFGQAQVDLFATQENLHWAGCHGTDVAEASSVRLSTDRSAPGSSGESAPGRGPSSFSSPVLASPSLVLEPDFPPQRLSMGDSRQEGSPLSGGRHHPPPSPRVVEVMGVAPEGEHLVPSCLSTEVVETILQSRAPSTRKLYVLKWKLFTSWCGHRQQDPVNCPVGTVLEFLQDRFAAGLAHSILRFPPRCAEAEASDQLCSVIHTRQGFESLAVWAYRSPSVFGRSSSSRRGMSQKLPAARTARAFKLPGLYVTPPVTSRFSIGLYAHVFQSVVTLEAFP